MMEDDDMFLVIVGDETGEVQIPAPIQIKQEYLYEDENERVEDILEQVQKHGEILKVEEDCQYTDLTQSFKEEATDDYELDSSSYADPEYVLESDGEKVQVKQEQRRSMLKPEECRSFVQELRDQYPNLRANKKLLVMTLCEIMRNVKKPPLPDQHYFEVDDVFRCTKCGQETESAPAAGRHYQEKHGPRYLMCYACGVDFRSTTNLYKHEKRCKARDRRVVLMARAACLGNKTRSRPFINYRNLLPPSVCSRRFGCQECDATFTTQKNLTQHEWLHLGQRPYQCHVCPAAYTSYSALMRHSNKHKDIQFICDHCQKSFKVKAALVAHMDTHRAVRKYGCSMCERRFAQKQALELHVRKIHLNLPPPHGCQICPKRYPRMSLLKTHMKNEHGLDIMTPKMLYKALPMLTDADMKQAAKIVFKPEAPPYLNDDSFMNDFEESDSRQEYLLPHHENQDIANYFKQFTGGHNSAKTIVIKSEIV